MVTGRAIELAALTSLASLAASLPAQVLSFLRDQQERYRIDWYVLLDVATLVVVLLMPAG